MKRLIAFTVSFWLAACTGDPAGIRVGVAASIKASSSGTSSITAAGDIAPLTTPTGDIVITSANPRAPFKNLALSGVSITLNTPTGDPAACRQPGSIRTYDSLGFGGNQG